MGWDSSGKNQIEFPLVMDDNYIINNNTSTVMRFALEFLSRPAIHYKAVKPTTTPSVVDAPSQLTPDDEPIHDKIAAIFAPIFESLDCIDKMIDQMPDKLEILKS